MLNHDLHIRISRTREIKVYINDRVLLTCYFLNAISNTSLSFYYLNQTYTCILIGDVALETIVRLHLLVHLSAHCRLLSSAIVLHRLPKHVSSLRYCFQSKNVLTQTVESQHHSWKAQLDFFIFKIDSSRMQFEITICSVIKPLDFFVNP